VAILLVLAVLVATNVATHTLRGRWYVTICLVATIALLLIGRAAGLEPADVGLAGSTLLRGALCGLALIALVAGVYALGVAIPRTRPAFSDREAMRASGPAIIRRVFVAIPLGTVVLEEVAFRGVLLALLDREYGTTAAVIISSALFGLWHVLPALSLGVAHETVAQKLPSGRRGAALSVAATVGFTAAGGVVLVLLRLIFDSLLPPAALHWALNGMGVAAGWWLARRVPR
jgi:membrane protease YdiL (CAAX protease family)